MGVRHLKARQIVATGRITRGVGCILVPSQQTGGGKYRVVIDGLFPSCTCEDFETTRGECKHLAAAREWNVRHAAGELDSLPEPPASIPRATYPRDWPAINKAQTTEKDWFLALLADLCRTVPEPDRKPTRGQRPVRMADAVFAAVFKVYSGFSARRFTCDLRDAADAGHVGRAMHFNSVLNVFDSDAVTPILSDLIARSAAPLREVETEFAVDSTGFSTSRFRRWFDIKYGSIREEADWVKAHVCCGTRTNVVTAVTILDPDTADSPQLPGLVEATAKQFTVAEVAADKAYTSNANFAAVERVGGTLYAAFKSNTTGKVGGLFEKAFHYFCLNRAEFLGHYHRRSMIESTFSMVKRKFGDGVRSKTDTAMRNEVLAKLVCHNLCCVIAAVYELGIDPGVIGLRDGAGDAPRDVIRFPGA